MDLETETICALATPTGTGGLGVIRVSGPRAFDAIDRVIRRAKNASCGRFAGHTLHRAEVVELNGEVIDDVLLAIFHAPRSYTGEDVVEISAHGGAIPLRRILARLLESGARLAQPGEFTQRAFLNGKLDLAQAEAVGDAIAAQTDEAHRLARRQQGGRLSGEVREIRALILGTLARIEASIDFPEDVGELDTQICENELCAADSKIHMLLRTADQGILYREGARVVLVGRPNVGKSSLLNALLRSPRAIVTPIPGTTRDVVEETLNLRGIPVRLADTAGLRETDDAVERLGVARTRKRMEDADLVVLVLDAAVGETFEDVALRRALTDRPHIVVWNKWDLVKDRPAVSLGAGEIAVSAATGLNMDTLEDVLAEALLQGSVPVDSDSAVVTHARHRRALESARDGIADALRTLHEGLPADFIALDVHGVLLALGEITGETATEDIIHEIFARFCIGK